MGEKRGVSLNSINKFPQTIFSHLNHLIAEEVPLQKCPHIIGTGGHPKKSYLVWTRYAYLQDWGEWIQQR